MADPLLTLPADFPGLREYATAQAALRNETLRAIVEAGGRELLPDREVPRWLRDAYVETEIRLLRDLTRRESRAWAAWWADTQEASIGALWGGDLIEAWTEATYLATAGLPMTPTQIETLRRGCMVLAGPSPLHDAPTSTRR